MNHYLDQIDSLTIADEQIQMLKNNLTLNQLKQYSLKLKQTLKQNVTFATNLLSEERKEERLSRREGRNVHA